MNFPVRDLEGEIRGVAALGFDFLELAMDPPGAHVADLGAKCSRILRAVADCGLDLVCHLPTFVSHADLTARIREASVAESLEALEIASALAARRVVLHPGAFVGLGGIVRDLSRQYAVESLGRILKRAGELGIPVGLENMFSRAGLLITPEDFAPVMDAFPSLGITLDIGHANIQGGTDRTLSFIRRYPSRIAHIHASDNWGRRDDHLPIGAGTVGYPRIVQELKSIPYPGWVTFEIFSPDRDYLRISREKFLRIWEGETVSGAASDRS
jgi:sugar phosphate isomerase/epimerase